MHVCKYKNSTTDLGVRNFMLTVNDEMKLVLFRAALMTE
jgi:hypothetical protein